MRTFKRGQCANSFSKVIVLIAFLTAMPGFAQTVGTILGTVKDTSGAVVPGANVTARETQTGISRTMATGDDGTYRFAALPVGHYDLKAEGQGYKTETQTGIVLNVAQEVVIDFSLQVGSLTSNLTVTAAPPVVDTTSSTLGGLVDEKSMAELPLNGRNYLDLSLLQPGVSQDTAIQNAGGGTFGTIYSSNGAPVTSNAFLLDGTPTQTLFGFNASSATGTSLGVDGILEYKVVTNSFSAEYGMNMGSQMTVISKGGTNDFHGDVFEYIRNRVTDARNYFDQSQMDCLANGGTDCPRSPQYQRNNFGGAFGGPIKKNKTFFWAVYEGLRQVKGNAVVAKGIPGACVTDGTTAPYTVTGNPAEYGYSADCGIKIPYNPSTYSYSLTVDPNIRPVLALYAPQYSQYTQISRESVDHAQMRVDQNFSGKDSFFARYTIDDASENVPGPGNGATAEGYGEFQDSFASRSQFITLAETHIFTPQLLSTARLAFSRTNLSTTITNTPNSLAADVLDNPGATMGLFIIGTTNLFSPYYTSMGPDQTSPNQDLQNTWSLGDDLFYTKGKHALKFGFLGNRLLLVPYDSWTPNGSTSFANFCPANEYGAADPTGLVCFLANQPFLELAEIPGSEGHRAFYYYTYGFYGQDDWRMTPRLTLNLGLRYEFNTTMNEVHGLQTFIQNPAANVSVVGGSGWTNPFVPGPAISNPSLKNFSPRVGFAWDPRGKGTTSIHSAFGIYYDLGVTGLNLFTYATNDPPYSGFATATASYLGPGNYLNNWYPGFMATPAADYGLFQPPFLWPGSTNTFTGYFPYSDFNTNQHQVQQPYLMQWNLSVDQQLPGAIGLTVAYVGTRGIHLWGEADGNPCVPTGYVNGLPNWANPTNTECPYANLAFPISEWPASAGNYYLGGHTCTVTSVNPYVGVVTVPSGRMNCNMGPDLDITSNSESWYNAMQVTVQKRLSRGFEFQSAYTWSKSLDNTQGSEPTYAEVHTPYTPPSYDKGLTAINAKQNWRFNVLYHFPNMRSAGFLPKLANGWWTGNIVAVQSGYPFTPAAPGDVSLNEMNELTGAYERPDIVTSANIGDVTTCALNGYGQCSGATPDGRVYNPNAVVFNRATVITKKPQHVSGDLVTWYNTNMFTEPLPGYLGGVKRGFLFGPKYADWDFSLVKDTKIPHLGEAWNIEFRAEFFNMLNHANFINNPVNGNAISGSVTAGDLSSARDGRDVQFALKLNF